MGQNSMIQVVTDTEGMSWCEDVKCQESAPPTISAEEAAVIIQSHWRKAGHLKSRSFPWNNSTGCIRVMIRKQLFMGMYESFQDGVFNSMERCFFWNSHSAWTVKHLSDEIWHMGWLGVLILKAVLSSPMIDGVILWDLLNYFEVLSLHFRV